MNMLAIAAGSIELPECLDNQGCEDIAAIKSAIKAKGVAKTFQSLGQAAFKVFDNVSVVIRENEFFTLLGPPAVARPLCSG